MNFINRHRLSSVLVRVPSDYIYSSVDDPLIFSRSDCCGKTPSMTAHINIVGPGDSRVNGMNGNDNDQRRFYIFIPLPLIFVFSDIVFKTTSLYRVMQTMM